MWNKEMGIYNYKLTVIAIVRFFFIFCWQNMHADIAQQTLVTKITHKQERIKIWLLLSFGDRAE